jgi:tRNA uridine 5-carboxymethylaminomethyl modification enzyme
MPARVFEQLCNTALYAGYIQRQEAEIRGFRREEAVALDADVDFAGIGGLSTELREKLVRAQPRSLGAASRIQGMTPAALAALAAHVRKQGRVGADECFT